MAQFLRNHGTLFLAIGTGVAVGTTVTLFVQRSSTDLHRELALLTAKLEELRREVEQLKTRLGQGSQEKANRVVSYLSAHDSSGEDDEEFQEAYGETEYPSSAFLTSTLPPGGANGAVASFGSFKELASAADKLLEGTDEDKQQALRILDNNQALYRDNADYLWRLAKAKYFVSQIEGAKGNQDTKKELVYASNQLAESAIERDDNLPNAHKWFAITLGDIGDYEGTQTKIKNGFVFKDHIEKAISLNPVDPSSHYLLGRWCFGVYMLTWIERKVAATLFATPPTSTAQEALKHFQQAEKLDPGKWKENMLYIAKCYIEMRDYYTAVTWLDKASAVPVNGADDRTAQTEVDTLLYKYSGYRR